MSQGPLGLPEDVFWTDPAQTRSTVIAAIAKDSFLGLMLDGPTLVALEDRDTLPLVGYYARSFREDAEVNADRHMLVLASDLDTRAVRVGLALDVGKTPEKTPPPKALPGLPPVEGTVANPFVTEIRRALALPWSESNYRVAVILRGRLSNAVTVALGPAPRAFRDTEVDRFLAEARVQRPLPPTAVVSPPAAVTPPSALQSVLPHYLPEGAPPVPDAPGFALEVPRVAVLKHGATVPLRGTFKLGVRPQDVVRQDPKTGIRPDVGDFRATAVVPITLVITGSVTPGPWVYPMNVPSHASVTEETPGAPVATGHFQLDVMALRDGPSTEQTYYLYAVAGEVIAGPAVFALVHESRLGT